MLAALERELVQNALMEMARAPLNVETAAQEIVVQLRGIEYACRQLAGIGIEPAALTAAIGTTAGADADVGGAASEPLQSGGTGSNGIRTRGARAAEDRSEGQQTFGV
jgi:hypothetical protein